MARVLRRPSARLIYGSDAADELGSELARLLVHRALLVTGSTLGADAALIARIMRAAGGRIASVYTGVRAHSPIASVQEAVSVVNREQIDAVVTLGGGSALVTGRGIVILAAEGRTAQELATRLASDGSWRSPRLPAPKIPIVALPTVPTTAIATAGTALSDPGYAGRYALFDPKARVSSVLVDDGLVASAPESLVRSAVRNGLAMAVEGLLAGEANPVSDALLAQSARLHLRYLADSTSVSRVDLALAGIMTGEGAELASVGLTAAVSHVIGHRFGTANGDLDALLLGNVLENLSGRGYPVDDLLAAAGLPDRRAVIAAIDAAPRLEGLSDIGVGADDLRSIADAAAGDFAYSKSPLPISRRDVEGILAAAYHRAVPPVDNR